MSSFYRFGLNFFLAPKALILPNPPLLKEGGSPLFKEGLGEIYVMD